MMEENLNEFDKIDYLNSTSMELRIVGHGLMLLIIALLVVILR